MTLRDRIESILKENGSPMRLREVTDEYFKKYPTIVLAKIEKYKTCKEGKDQISNEIASVLGTNFKKRITKRYTV